LTRSLPAHSAYGLPVYVAASQATPFLGFARNDKVLGRERAAISGRGPAARDRTSPPGGTTGGGSHSSSFAVHHRQMEHSRHCGAGAAVRS